MRNFVETIKTKKVIGSKANLLVFVFTTIISIIYVKNH